MRHENLEKCFFILSASKNENHRTISAAIAAVNIWFAVAAIVLNGGIILVIAKKRQLYTSYNFLILNMCMTCFLTGAFAQTLLGLSHFQVALQPCKIFMMIAKILTLSSYLSLCVVLFERYIKIFHPLHCKKYVTPFAITISCLLPWIISAPVSLIFHFTENSYGVRERFFQAAIYTVGFIWISFVNIKTTFVVRRIQKDIRNQFKRADIRKDIKAVLFTTASIISFIVSYSPYCILSFSLVRYQEFSWYAVSIIASLICLNANVTPILMILFHKYIRRDLSNCFRCK